MDSDLKTSSWSRFLSMSKLLAKVGGSVAGNELANLFRGVADKKALQSENWEKNAQRIVETLGDLKGGVMKVGQMLSLQEDLLPPEIAAIMRHLQKEAPPVPFSKMNALLKRDLKEKYKSIKNIDKEAFAAASIGQVHLATLEDGRKVALKIQYPGIAKAVKSDLKNLKTFLKAILSFLVKVNLDLIWRELEEKLLQELDYSQEAENLQQMQKLWQKEKGIIIPKVFPHLCSKRVLTMEYTEGIPPDEAVGENYSEELKNKWAAQLFKFISKGLLSHRILHVDPNFANFAFKEDGSLVVYDYGCIQKVPEEIAKGIKDLFHALKRKRPQDMPYILKNMGIHRSDGSPLSDKVLLPPLEIIKSIFSGEEYIFNENKEIVNKMVLLKKNNIVEVMDAVFPKEMIFIDRTVVGHFGNLGKLQAKLNWLAHYDALWT